MGAWSVSIVNALISLAFTLDVNPIDGVCRFNPIYITVVISVIPSICLLSIVVLYVLIYRTLRTKVFSQNVSIFGRQNIFKQIFRYFKYFKEEKDEDTVEDKKLYKEVKTTIILFLTVTTAFIIMIPAFVMYAIYKICPHALNNSIFYSCVCLFLLHPIINPLMYVYGIPNIRKRGVKLLRRMIMCKKELEMKLDESLSQKITQSSAV